jgi:hypothetical protein
MFVEPNIAFALIVHWKRGLNFVPAKVGLVHTTDNGAHWFHVTCSTVPTLATSTSATC